MSITVNTNMQALRIQQNLAGATNKMNTAMERMSSGSKINSAKDDAAGLAVSNRMSKEISGTKVASDNVAIGNDLLSTTEGTLNVVLENLTRIRDLTEQAANGTYSSDDLIAIRAEVDARMTQITDLKNDASFNGIKLLDGGSSAGITLQVGTQAGDVITLDNDVFDNVDTSTLTALGATIQSGTAANKAAFLTTIDTAITGLTTRVTNIGAYQNRLSAVSDGLEVQETNLTSALSTIKDADVAEESASYVQSQILQSASATLLVQANSAPQVALTLIQG